MAQSEPPPATGSDAGMGDETGGAAVPPPGAVSKGTTGNKGATGATGVTGSSTATGATGATGAGSLAPG